MLDIKNLRKDYGLQSLDLKDLHANPFIQFQNWLQEAQQSGLLEPNAMTLATASVQAKPSSRTMLLKGIDARGFLFFTSYESRKAQELDSNPFASATFFWRELERQVIIEGSVEKLTQEESHTYFATRPRSNQLGAWTSHQGQIILSREVLEQSYQRLDLEYAGKEIPMPPYWGGYRLCPIRFEFWQGRKSRLHDRFQYEKTQQEWHIDRLSP